MPKVKHQLKNRSQTNMRSHTAETSCLIQPMNTEAALPHSHVPLTKILKKGK